MTDYSKLKNAELESLLKERGLPHSGKKADLIARLVEHDSSSGASKTTTSTNPTSTMATAASKPSGTTEDEIDWEEDNANAANPSAITATSATTQPQTASDPVATITAAAGKGRAKNPLAVPNQVPAIDPSKTDDLTVSKDQTTVETSATAAPTTTTEAPPAKPAPAPPVDFSSNMPATSLDEELAKRKARAARFGNAAGIAAASDTNTTAGTSDESIKTLERAKRFGTGPAADGTGDKSIAISKLNEALPERREKRKRGGDPSEGQKAGAALDDEGMKRRRAAGGGAAKVGKGNAEKKPNGGAAVGAANGNGNGNSKPTEKQQGGPKWMNEADRQKAEARKGKFAVPSAKS